MKILSKSILITGIVPLFFSLGAAYADLPFSYGKANSNYVDNTSAAANGVYNPYYFGGTIGTSDATTYCDGETSCVDSDTAWKLFGGYKFTNNLSAEGTYTSLGDMHKNGENADISAISVDAVGSMQLTEKFDIFGKVGAMRWSSQNTTGDRDGFGVTYGVGAKMRMSESTRIRAEWEQYPGIETSGTEDSDVNMLSIGVEISSY
jgi:predicted porin